LGGAFQNRLPSLVIAYDRVSRASIEDAHALSMIRRAPFFSAVIAFALLATTTAHASEQTEFDKARAAYLARKYDDADAHFRVLLDPQSPTLHDPVLVSQARMYWGASLLAQKKQTEAATVFEKLLLTDVSFEPDPLSFPTDVIEFFIDTRQRLKDRLNAAAAEAVKRAGEQRAREESEKRRAAENLMLLEKMASEERNTVHHSRYVALLPFGVGQFQNDQRIAGGVFLGVESALLIAAGVMIPVYLNELHNIRLAYLANDTTRAEGYANRAGDERNANLALNGAFAGAALIGIAQAQIAFEPDTVEVNKRPIPTVTFAPMIAPLAPTEAKERVGGIVGIRGEF
jgi:hypothetical protein